MMKLVSANIEGDLHLDKVSAFLQHQNPDVVCLQEVFQRDVPILLGQDFKGEFLPMCLKVNRSGELAPWGLSIASRRPLQRVRTGYYHRATQDLVAFDEKNKRHTIWQGFAGLQLEDDGAVVNVITTHFTWTPNGVSDANQDADIVALLGLMRDETPHVLCGDFNIPRRQNELYKTLMQHYTDHVPPEITSSIYVPLHYARHKPNVAERLAQYMVDYILSTPGAYRVETVALHGGISDHYGLTAEINGTP